MSLVVRAYNVRFGDSLLLSWDEDDGKHHAWIDFGNFHNDPNAVFDRVYDDVAHRTGGRLDLLVVSHRHLDHLEGFHVERKKFAKDFTIDRLWHAHVTKAADGLFDLAAQAMQASLPLGAREGEGEIARIFRNNHAVATADRMEDILGTLKVGKALAVHRQTDLAAEKALPPGMKRMEVRILAPEKDSSVYLKPLGEMLSARKALDRHFDRAPKEYGGDGSDEPASSPEMARLLHLADFARLRRQLRSGGLEVLAAVDRTRNNTSVVLRFRYGGTGGTTLLFAGDAEETSWEVMRRKKVPLSAHLVKVGHHGSINASPDFAFARVFPTKKASNVAIVSTDETRFTGENEVPNAGVLAGWASRLKEAQRLRRTDRIPVGDSLAVEFPD
jgi:hypothetical protein